MLPGRDRLISLGGGGGGRRREELAERERIESFSIGGGGTGEPRESKVIASGSRGSSGRISCAFSTSVQYDLPFTQGTYE